MALHGFVQSSDVNTIKLNKDDIEFRHSNPTATDCSLLRIIQGQFKLVGENSQFYEIEESSIPQIISHIQKRPVNAIFYSISKEYDGNDTVDSRLLRFRFVSTGAEQSGIVWGDNKIRKYFELAISIDSGGNNYEIGQQLILHKDSTILPNSSEDSSDIIITIKDVDVNGSVTEIESTENLFSVEGIFSNSYSSIIRKKVSHNQFNELNCDYSPSNIPIESLQSVNATGYGLVLDITLSLSSQEEDLSNPVGNYFTNSDVDAIRIYSEEVKYSNSNSINQPQKLIFSNAHLCRGSVDGTQNYTLNNIEAWGVIRPRITDFSIQVADKVYDGSNALEYTESFNRAFDYDDITINRNNFHANIGNLIRSYSDYKEYSVLYDDVQQLRNKNIVSTIQTGVDGYKYVIRELLPSSSQTVRIYKKHISININFIRYVVSTRRWEVNYCINDYISGDDIYLDTDALIMHQAENEFGLVSESVPVEYLEYEEMSTSIPIKYTNSTAYGRLVDESQLVASNLILSGQDCSNYILDTDQCSVPIYIVNKK